MSLPSLAAPNESLWAQVSGFEVLLLVLGGVLTLGLLAFFIVLFRKNK